MSWTLTKKLDAFAGPGEIKMREAVLDPQVSPEEIKSREVELGLKVGLLLHQLLFFATVSHSSCVVRQLLRNGEADPNTALKFCCSGGGPRRLGLPGWRLRLNLHSFVPFPHLRPRP